MSLDDNEKFQEMIMVTQDKFLEVDKKWWYAILIVAVLAFPLYLGAKTAFSTLFMSAYSEPELIYSSEARQPLQVTAKGVLSLGGNLYAGYARVRNVEFDWGVPEQRYSGEFKTFGGTVVTRVEGSTFILPSSEKLIVFSRFTADQKPDELIFSLQQTNFNRRPQLQFDYESERIVTQNLASGLVVSAGIRNLTPFIVKQVNLPVAVYNNRNEVVAVGFTFINDLLPAEIRTLQYTWPGPVEGAVRAEVMPEVNVFDRNAFQITAGGPSF